MPVHSTLYLTYSHLPLPPQLQVPAGIFMPVHSTPCLTLPTSISPSYPPYPLLQVHSTPCLTSSTSISPSYPPFPPNCRCLRSSSCQYIAPPVSPHLHLLSPTPISTLTYPPTAGACRHLHARTSHWGSPGALRGVRDDRTQQLTHLPTYLITYPPICPCPCHCH